MTNSLRDLKLNHVILGQASLEAIRSGIAKNGSLLHLDLSYNAIADKFGPILVHMIKD